MSESAVQNQSQPSSLSTQSWYQEAKIGAQDVCKWAVYSFCIGFLRSHGKKRAGFRSAGYSVGAWIGYQVLMKCFEKSVKLISYKTNDSSQPFTQKAPARYESVIMILILSIFLEQKKVLRLHSKTAVIATMVPLLFRSSSKTIPFVAIAAALKKKKVKKD